MNLPSIYRKAATNYYDRLVGVRRNPGRLRDVLEDATWEELLEYDVLLVERREAHEPLRAHIEEATPKKPLAGR